MLPIRWIISLLGIYACALVYTQRAGMSVAIVAMTSQAKASSTPVNATHECAAEDGSNLRLQTTTVLDNSDHPEEKPEFEWSGKLQVSLRFCAPYCS